MRFRSYFLFLQFFFIVLLFNPFILLLLPTSLDSYDLQRLCQLALFLIVGIQLMWDTPLRQQSLAFFINLANYKKVLIFIFFLLGSISSLLAKMPRFGLLEVASLFLLMVTAFSFAGWCALLQEKFINYCMVAIITCFSINAIIAVWTYLYFQDNLLQPITQWNFNFILNFLASPGYMNRRFFDDVLVFVIPLLMFFFLKKSSSRWQQTLIFLLLAFTFARGILSGSRIYFYEPLAILLLFPFLFGKKSFSFLQLQIAVVVIGGLLYLLLYQAGLGYSWQALHVIPTQVNLHLNLQSIGLMNLDGRSLLWHIAWGLIQNHPLLGAGPLHYGFYAYSTEVYAAHPHSALLVFAAEWGLPALICLIILSLTGLIALIRKTRETANTDLSIARMALTAALIGGFLMMSIDGLILMPAGQTMLAVIVGLSLFYFVQPSPDNALSVSKLSDRFFTILIVFALILLCWGAFPYLSAAPDIVNQYLANCQQACTLSPNYWSQGFIQFY